MSTYTSNSENYPMALEKIEGVDKIVIGYPYMVLKIRRATTILDDGKKVTSMFAHDELYPGKLDDNDALVDTNMSKYPTEVQSVANAVWTDAIKESYRQFLISNK